MLRLVKRKKKITIPEVGTFNFIYREGIRVCKSETDKSYPFFNEITHKFSLDNKI